MKPLFVQYCAKDYLDGVQTLSPWEELAYRRICDLIYATGDRLPDDDKKLTWMTKVGRRWKAIKVTLISMGKIHVADGFVRNGRCLKEIASVQKMVSEKCPISPTFSAPKGIDKQLENNETASENGQRLTRAPNRKLEEESRILDSKTPTRAVARAGSPPRKGLSRDERRERWRSRMLEEAQRTMPPEKFEELVAAMLEDPVPPWVKGELERLDRQIAVRQKASGERIAA